MAECQHIRPQFGKVAQLVRLQRHVGGEDIVGVPVEVGGGCGSRSEGRCMIGRSGDRRATSTNPPRRRWRRSRFPSPWARRCRRGGMPRPPAHRPSEQNRPGSDQRRRDTLPAMPLAHIEAGKDALRNVHRHCVCASCVQERTSSAAEPPGTTRLPRRPATPAALASPISQDCQGHDQLPPSESAPCTRRTPRPRTRP
jgi:hypothetical protein